MAFDWERLLNQDRRRPTTKVSEDKRSEFDRDYDRLVSSSSLRRLQDKTQVFPLEHHDFIRTRLTHSLEVSTLGRSFGVDVVRTLAKKGIEELTGHVDQIAAILSTVCLAHDIGNPPFGHFGESAIRSWFDKHARSFSLTDSQKHDLVGFEGNAQGFRIITYLQSLNDQYGMNFTFGTLASFLKYTASSLEVDTSAGKSKQKVGYFTSEKSIFDEVQERTDLKGARHPLAFLMEASDDIMYCTVDLEDGLKKGVVKFDSICDNLENELRGTDHHFLLERVRKVFRDRQAEGWSIREAEQIACINLKIWAIGVMFRACVDAFVDNYRAIMSGEFDKSLITASSASNLQAVLIRVAREHVYSSSVVTMLEVVGARVIQGLFSHFVPAVMSEKREDATCLEGKVFRVISESLRTLNRIHGRRLSDDYDRLQLVTDFISRMTDSYALNLYRRLEGMQLDF